MRSFQEAREYGEVKKAEKQGYINRIASLEISLTQKDNELKNLSPTLISKTSEIAQLRNQVTNLQISNSQKDAQINLLNIQLKEANIRLKEENTAKDKMISELQAKLTQAPDQEKEEQKALKEHFETKLVEANAKINFMNRFFEEAKLEKAEFKAERAELKKELKSFKKSFLKKHELSHSQSIEIEKLKVELKEMSKLSVSHIEGREDLNSGFLNLNFDEDESVKLSGNSFSVLESEEI